MSHELRFRKDLFQSTAEYYDKYRPRYPEPMLGDLRSRVPLTKESRVLDLACGVGHIAFALAPNVREVVAIDQEPEMVAFGARKARELGVTNIESSIGTAEDAALDGAFDVVTIGNAFQRLDREVVARRLRPHLGARGCVALLWGGTPSPGDQPWQAVVQETFTRWMRTDRVPAGWEDAIMRDPHEQVLERAGFHYEGKFEFTLPQRWTSDDLIGFMYSTSFLNRAALGTRAVAFERDLRAELERCSAVDAFEEQLTWGYELARVSA